MAGDGHIRKAQQRRRVMKTVQPYSILPCPTHATYCLHPLFSLSCSFKPRLFYSAQSFKYKHNLGTKYNMRFGCWEIYSAQYGFKKKKNRSENALLPWQVRGIMEIMRAPDAVIILNQLGGKWFYCTTGTVNTHPRVISNAYEFSFSILTGLQC